MGSLPDSLSIDTIRTPGLGDSTYVVAYDGVGLIVDPQRDIDRFTQVIENRDSELRWVLETHIHNDYVSGGPLVAETAGAELVMPAGAAPVFQHTPAFHNEPFSHGSLTIRPIHTPGHTPEHVSYVLEIEGTPVGVFSGGSLLVGSAGRSDLLGDDRAESLARLQYGSVNRLAKLPDATGLYPTHGAGSFCAVSGGGSPTSTIGDERTTSPVLQYPDADSFVAGQLSALQPYPSYYRHMGPINLDGGDPIPPHPPSLSVQEAADALSTAEFIDMRPRERFAAGHIPGALAVEHQDAFGTWVGWLITIDSPMVLIADRDQDITDAIVQLARIGYDNVLGVFTAMDEWDDDGKPVAATDTVTPEEGRRRVTDGGSMIDVRAPNEWDEHHLHDSVHMYVPDIPDASVGDLGTADPIVACGSGFRAMIAASLLERRGISATVVAYGGIDDLLA